MKMLEFNPHFRSTAHDLVSMEIFDDIRKLEMEIPASKPICLKHIDGPSKFNYETCKPINLNQDDLVAFLEKEILEVEKMKLI